jgi:hypothetical protein
VHALLDGGQAVDHRLADLQLNFLAKAHRFADR